MKLHWAPASPFVRKVMLCVHEAGLADRIEQIHSKVRFGSSNPEVMRYNPLGKIPTLILDNGEALFDSSVICAYLDSLHMGPKLFPHDLQPRMQALRWEALGDGLSDVVILWTNEYRREARSVALLRAFNLKVESTLAFLEKEAPAMTAAAFNVGHAALISGLMFLDPRFPDLAWRERYPRLLAWYDALLQRPSVVKETYPFSGPVGSVSI
jgi:glutathione S-transferase